jgi:hypothetical protein
MSAVRQGGCVICASHRVRMMRRNRAHPVRVHRSWSPTMHTVQRRSLDRQLMRAGVLLVVVLSGLAECLALWRARWQGVSGRA